MATTQSQHRTAVATHDVSRFDLLLAAIPLALAAGIVSSFVAAIPFVVGVAIGATIAAALVAYGIYAVTQQPTMSTDSPQPREDPTIE